MLHKWENKWPGI